MKTLRTIMGVTVCALVVMCGNGFAGVVTLNFDTDGQLPHQEAAANYPGSTVDRYPYRGMTDEVSGGLWKLHEIPGGDQKGYLLYYGNVPELATSDTSVPASINVKLRLLAPLTNQGELYFNGRTAAGAIWLYVKYDPDTGVNQIGGRHANGSVYYRDLPPGKTLGEFHILTMTWNPADGGVMPAKLYVDGEHIGDTYAGVNYGTSTQGYIEFGDGVSNDGTNSVVDTDWLRFGNDEVVITPSVVATPALDPDGSLGGIYTTPTYVTMSCATPGATIRYTTDGSDPTESSPAYTSPVLVTPPMTLKVKAWAEGYIASELKTAYYGKCRSVVLRFNTDGQLPHQENTNLTAHSYFMTDAVADGLWKGNTTGTYGGYLYYDAYMPELATANTDMPISINVRTRLLRECLYVGEYYYIVKTPIGMVKLAFNYDPGSGISQIGGQHENGSVMWRDLPTGKTLGEFHNYAITLHPAELGSSAPAKLWVDGEYIGDTYINSAVTGTLGFIEFGDGDGSNVSTQWETDWVRFGLDENVYGVEPPDTVDASTFGYDPNDATDALQAAIDTGACTVIVPDMGSDWIVRPIFLRMSNQQIVLEEGVAITAKRGEFMGTGDRLFSNRSDTTIYSTFNLKITGSGNVLKMWQDDYTQPPYPASASRSALTLYSPYNVTISGVTIKDTGGDGVYIGLDPFRPGTKSQNIVVDNVVIDNAYRNGISVIAANDLLIDNCVVANTSGTSPQAGIDFEPNNESNYLVDCVVRNTILHNNYNQGIVTQLDHLSSAGQNEATITIENCTILGNGGGAGMWNTLGLPGLTVTDCLFVDNSGYGVLQTAGTSPGVDVTYSAFWNNSSGAVGGAATLGAGSLTGVEPLFASTTPGDEYYMYLATNCPAAITQGASDGGYMGARPVAPTGPVCGDAQHPYPTGDLDKDCYVNWADFGVFASHWLDSGCASPDWCEGADLDQSTDVNWSDFSVFAANWLACTDPNPPCNYNP